MSATDFKLHIGKFVLISNFALFGLIVLLFMMGGFLDEEISLVLKALAPIQSVYMAAIIKYMLSNKSDNISQSDETYSSKFTFIVRFIIYSHIIVLGGLITLRAFGGLISNSNLETMILLVETFFGAYVGTIITDLFKTSTATD